MTKPHISKKLKQLVRLRAQGCCEYCLSQETYSPDTFSIEHITPFIINRDSTSNNLALACQTCNNHKYNKTHAPDPTAKGEVVPIFHPRKDEWHRHFLWNDDYSLIIGITPTGCATIDALHLNREGVVNLRIVLLLIGKHPPQLHQDKNDTLFFDS
jgi:hypothetical protein